jgi:hypothetical protein
VSGPTRDQGGGTLLLALWVPGAAGEPDAETMADVFAWCINEHRHSSDFLTRLGDVEVSAIPTPQWLTPQTLAQLRAAAAGHVANTQPKVLYAGPAQPHPPDGRASMVTLNCPPGTRVVVVEAEGTTQEPADAD